MPKKEKRSRPQSARFKTIKCECGIEILVVPDLDAMTKAIEAHIRAHLKGIKDRVLRAWKSNLLWDLLVAETFEIISVEPVAEVE